MIDWRLKMDLSQYGKEMTWIGDLLQTIRNLSKDSQNDYTKASYASDIALLQHLLDNLSWSRVIDQLFYSMDSPHNEKIDIILIKK